MFDTHCHFNLEPFKKDPDEIINLSREHGVDQFLVPGIDSETSLYAISLSIRFPGVIFAGVGVHPGYSSKSKSKEIQKLIDQHKEQIIAIGEIGLDYYRDFSPKQKQIDTLNEMLSLANIHNLPICLHNREAEDDLLSILSRWYEANQADTGQVNGVFHAFEGSDALYTWGIDHNFYFGIGGLITFKRSERLREQVEKIGIDYLVLETDSPYLTPNPFRGKQNYPGNLKYIVKAISNCLKITEDEVIHKTNQNARRLFRLI